ncbi:acyl-CoA dehydrogenase [Shewanella sp. NFH-SH190041]|uniref:acyl-CoA dehydrogenase family protein n=1 Tax=Shewanella sp. NFH-SH190041 TaxID=2950245 RepID=UPI0021C46FBA|nr:acyl-CoA dehydrogenase family protein [Shewanella sp. NFH-SH190041]BDM64239.1 acyl-CoA dehydrogenase [Shewanella sp. NFH-SH190041]
MSLIYSQDEQMLADTAREFLAEHSPVSAQRELRDAAAKVTAQESDTADNPLALRYSPQLWQNMMELGWGAVAFAEEQGGLAFGYKGMGAVFQELGRHLSPSPMLSSIVLCGSVLEALGSPSQQVKWLPALMQGEQRLVLAVEEHHRHNPSNIAATANRCEQGYRLSGAKVLVFDGIGADGYLVSAKLDGNLALFIVPANSAGLTVSPQTLVDARNCAALVLRDVTVTPDALLGDSQAQSGEIDPTCAQRALDRALDHGRVCLAAEVFGACEALFALTCDYLKTRVQFDVPIGAFQALQHRAAWCFVELELAKSTLMAALASLDDATQTDCPVSSSLSDSQAAAIALAKWKVGQMADRITAEAVQMHGGIGVTDELDVGLYLKRIRVAQMALGDSDFLAQRYQELGC